MMWTARVLWAAAGLSLLAGRQAAATEFQLGLLMPRRHIRLGWDRNAAAVTMAIERATADGILANNTVSVVYRDDRCKAKYGAGMAVTLREEYDVHAYIGPPCSESTKPAALLASFWNIPMFSQASSDPTLSNKFIYSTLVRMGPPFNHMGVVFVEIFRKFNWKRIVMISRRPIGNRHVFCDYVSRSLEVQFLQAGLRLEDWIKIRDGVSDDNIERILDRTQQRARLVLLCAHSNDERRILLRARQRGMTAGNFVFFTIDHLPEATVWKPWQRNDEDDAAAKEAYQSVLHITVASLAGPKVDEFRRQIPIKMAEPPWNYNGSLESGEVGSKYSLFLHDTVYLYLLALNDTLQQGGDPRNGSLMFENAMTKQFDGATGRVVMDSNGDRYPYYWVWDLKPGADKFQMWTEIKMTDPEGQRFNPLTPGSWNSPNNDIPPDEPLCGLLGVLCTKDASRTSSNMIIALSVAAALTISVGIVVLLVIRRRTFEEELKSMWWRIPFNEIRFVNSFRKMPINISTTTLASERRSRFSIQGSVATLAQRPPSGVIDNNRRLAFFKGMPVEVAMLDCTAHSLTRDDLIQLRHMRVMNHEGVQQLIGACLDISRPVFVLAYCSKGTLWDILQQDEIKLDWMFKISLITDLANAMNYLHESPLKCHGHLQSRTCAIDNRWALKICDLGSGNFRQIAVNDDVNAVESRRLNYNDMLWTAPELLRLSAPPARGTASGDVYSFAIVMFEIIYRTRPFVDVDPKDAVAHLVAGNKTCPYRPRRAYGSGQVELDSRALDLLEDCWLEEHDARPMFASITRTLHNFNKGKKFNMVDNMLTMLEKYANNMEELVEQRTAELMEEKLKTDQLLYSMLPKSTAEQLKRGSKVEPEMFDAVTIFFSDIVGFTKLSSTSSAMQIINFLNDLYSLFDDNIDKHDVYKVETIGDAYMVVSGLPQRNGDQHAFAISDLALDLLSTVKTFKIRHRPSMPLLIRVGLHTGACAAGVVGLKMPRYCLFGDTVNVSSRMESTGEALKIHISETTYAVLAQQGEYIMVRRGNIEVKGKGAMATYWLTGKCRHNADLTSSEL